MQLLLVEMRGGMEARMDSVRVGLAGESLGGDRRVTANQACLLRRFHAVFMHSTNRRRGERVGGHPSRPPSEQRDNKALRHTERCLRKQIVKQSAEQVTILPCKGIFARHVSRVQLVSLVKVQLGTEKLRQHSGDLGVPATPKCGSNCERSGYGR